MEISITLIIIVLTSLISFSAFNNGRLMNDLIFYPPSIQRGQWYRFFTCGVLHADFGHLIFNMMALYLFGMGSKIETEIGDYYTGVEYRFIDIFGNTGKLIYLGMYVLALAASLIPTYIKNKNNYHYRSLGASGAVSAVVFASILFNPLMGMGLFFIPIYIAGFLFGIIYLIVSNYFDKQGGGNVNHSAHIAGAIFGIVFIIVVCQLIGNAPVLSNFVEELKAMDPSDIIQFGN